VYYLDTASIIGKKQDGQTYYYLAESARVNGKPRIVSHRYLGSAEAVMTRLGEAGPGDVAAAVTSASATSWRLGR
jgi:hypothetical protein